MPLWLQSSLQSFNWQSDPLNPGLQWHTPLMHSPLFEQFVSHVGMEQSAPEKPLLQMQVLSMQFPLFEQLLGQNFSEQSSFI
jgi:hypothetical protein